METRVECRLRIAKFNRLSVLLLICVFCSSCSAMVDKKGSVAYPHHIKERSNQIGQSPKEVFEVASLIQDNAVGEDMKLLSSVFHNRIKQGLSLEQKELPQIVAHGLPVCAPEVNVSNTNHRVITLKKEAVEAALYPQSSAYLYYCREQRGRMRFFQTYSELESYLSQNGKGMTTLR